MKSYKMRPKLVTLEGDKIDSFNEVYYLYKNGPDLINGYASIIASIGKAIGQKIKSRVAEKKALRHEKRLANYSFLRKIEESKKRKMLSSIPQLQTVDKVEDGKGNLIFWGAITATAIMLLK